MSKATADWPQIVLTNQASFKVKGETYLEGGGEDATTIYPLVESQ